MEGGKEERLGQGNLGFLDLRNPVPGDGADWQGIPGVPVLGAEPNGSEAEPRMTEGGTQESQWGPGRCQARRGRSVPRIAVHGAQ